MDVLRSDSAEVICLKKKKRRKIHFQQFYRRKKLERYCSFLHSACPVCGGDTFFYHKYDSIVCFDCDVWFSKACNDPDCPFCAGRPETPSAALFGEREEITSGAIGKKEYLLFHYQRKYNGQMRKKRKLEKYISWEEYKWQRK